MKHSFILSFAAVLLCACQSLLPEIIEIVSLGIVPDSITVPAAAGEDGVRLIADRQYKVELLSGEEWIDLGVAESDTLSFSFAANEGYRRCARIRVSADGRSDELLVKQEGPFVERVELSEHELYAPAEGCEVNLRLYSNLPSDFFSVSSSSQTAIRNLSLNAYSLSFEVEPTTNRDKRSYAVSVSYVDGWGEVVSDSVTIIQEAYD